jgi:polyphosphate kinase
MSDATSQLASGGLDGRWTRHHRGPDGEPLADLQDELIEEHARRRKRNRGR